MRALSLCALGVSLGAGLGPSLGAAPVAAESPSIRGFSDEAVVAQRDREKRFDAAIDAAEIGEWIERLSAHPRHVGAPYTKESAEYMASLFREWGYEAQLERFDVLFPTPVLRKVELVEPHSWSARLEEPVLPEDPSSAQREEQLPIYNAFSIDGDVTGELVYVNYGVPADYEELARRGIDVEGKIVIARYGGSWRGIKPKVAAEKGAIGCLLYSDPRDDGFFRGDPYPEGGWRSESGAQRGSVADMPLYPGDPLTPNVGAVDGVERLALEDTPTLTKIPVLPVSWSDAKPLLAALGGPVAPAEWRGALPLTYHLGPGPAKVRLHLKFDWDLAPAYNVVARLEGRQYPDQWVLRGNHHDAWVNGATDPVSGMAAVLAEAKALGMLAQDGWRPRRTVVFAGWDAEEPGLLGSTEWVEHHAEDLTDKAVAYINTDSNSRGFLRMGGSHTLQRFMNEIARDVRDPQTGLSVRERLRAARRAFGNPEERAVARGGGDLPLYALGSGSDYSPFLQHLGIASLNLGFGGEGAYGQYHSAYDTFEHYRRFMDPTFEYGVALAQVAGRAVLRLAEAEVLPFEFSALAETTEGYVEEVEALAEELRAERELENQRIRDGVYAAAWDPEEQWVVPESEEPVPHVSLAPLRNGLDRLKRAAQAYADVTAEEVGLGSAALDRALYKTERRLTRGHGLPRRPWYVHHLYAPGFYTGYGVKTLPGVREALEEGYWEEADEQAVITGAVLEAVAEQIEEATRLLVREGD